MTPARGDLTAYRWAPFDETIPFEGVDFTGGTFAMEVRAYRDSPASLLTLAMANPQGISVTVATSNGLPTSNVRIRINEATIEALLPFPASGVEPGQSVDLVYDLVITTSALGKRRWLEGAFIIQPGVTQV
jgi:hypothetical protein